jgi:hypothetical protein
MHQFEMHFKLLSYTYICLLHLIHILLHICRQCVLMLIHVLFYFAVGLTEDGSL